MDLLQTIRVAVGEGRFLVTRHARQRLAERGLRLWQIEVGLQKGRLISIDVDAEPNPCVNLEQDLPDGTRVMAVWAWMATTQRAILVTAYIPNEN